MTRALATGYRANNGIKIAIKFPETLFHRVKQRAIKENKKSISEMVTQLCEIGLLDLEDSDREEINVRHISGRPTA